jgi:HTH-type transcriptional regulator/antitoxin HigA
MRKAHPLVAPHELPKTYAALVALHVPRPIHDMIGYENTVALVDALAGARLNKDQEDYLEILSQLVEVYEAEHLNPPRTVTGIELVKSLMEENEMTGEDLADLLGVDRSVAYKILKGSRNLTTEHVRKLANRFVMSADSLIT